MFSADFAFAEVTYESLLQTLCGANWALIKCRVRNWVQHCWNWHSLSLSGETISTWMMRPLLLLRLIRIYNDNDLAAATGHDCTTDSPWRFTGTNIKYNLDLIETIDLVETIQYDIQHLLQTVTGQWGNHFRWFYLSSDLEKGPIFFITNCLYSMTVW